MHLAKILGACPSRARPYKVLDAIYWSELAAEKVKIRIAALVTWGSPLIPAEVTMDREELCKSRDKLCFWRTQ